MQPTKTVTNSPAEKERCDHCYHRHTGPLMMVIKDGHIVERCCKCGCLRQVHRRARW